MSRPPLIVEGDWEEVAKIGAQYADRRIRLIVLPPAEEMSVTSASAPIEEEIAAIWSDVTEEQWASLLPDLSDQIDHYVYGTPKR